MNVPDVRKKRKNWIKNLPVYDRNKLVFLDESSVNIDMTRGYGRSMGGTRCTDKAPLSRPKSTTVLSSVRLNGETAYVTYQGGTTRERFVDYLKDTLIPTLHDGDVIIMDNMRSHHVKEVAEVIEQSDKHLSLLYLPPYSPDFNPIEMMWSKIKAILRMLKARVPEMLSKAVEIAFSKIVPSDCVAWFSAVLDR